MNPGAPVMTRTNTTTTPAAAAIAGGRLSRAIAEGVLQPAAALSTVFDPTVPRRFLELLRRPEAGCTELRVLNATFDRRGRVVRGDAAAPGRRGSTLGGWFADADRLAAQARRLDRVSAYVTINPVSPALRARSDSRLAHVCHTTRDADIVCLRWLFLDIDPIRPPDISSTDAELAAAVKLRDAILEAEPELRAVAMWGCSGNGGWILVRLPDYPNDPEHRGLVAEATRVIASRYNNAAVVIDTATVNPARLIGLPGTVKAKGSPRPDRPWRPVMLDGVGSGLSRLALPTARPA
jgi:hypothetical protein